MKSSFTPYIRLLSLLVIILSGAVLLWNYVFTNWKASCWWPFYLLFFILVTSTVHFILINALKKNPRHFISLFMITTLAKLVLYIVALFLNVIYSPNHPASIIAPFLFFYIVFTFFEVRQLSVLSRKKNMSAPENSATK